MKESDMPARTIRYYSDYKSPYAYLAKHLAYALEDAPGIEVDWLPYTLDIPAYLGSATVDQGKSVVEQSRNAHQWRRVKYSYMDCRREANRLGLTIRGTQKIFDSSLANIGLLFAKQNGIFRAYNDRVFERFWKRELDIENPQALGAVIAECGADASGFYRYAARDGRDELQAVQTKAEADGVFGVPTLLLSDGDLYWGREHFARVREIVTGTPAPN
jgi:2-hydroxychromene-2-carboxylate isomerase